MVVGMVAQQSEQVVGGPFRYRDAPDRGIPTGGLRRKEWRRIFRGVHASAAEPLTHILRCRSALMLHPSDGHLSHVTGARFLGVAVPHSDEVDVTVHRRQDRHYRPGVRPHYRAAESLCVRVQGLPVSAPLQLFIELAGVLSLVDTVVAGDHMVKLGLFTPDRLVAHCHAAKGKHTRKARRAAALVRAAVDSPMESRLRLLIVLAGLPEPVVNFKIRDEGGRVVRRFELCYPALKLIIEFDGRHHIERIEQWEADIERREEIDHNEWRIVVVVASGVYRHAERTLVRVQQALADRGVRCQLDDEWRRHFAV